MIVSLNTTTGLNSNSGKAYGNSRQGSARLSAPICDSVSFEGSEAKSPMKSFFKKAGMIFALGTTALGFTSCDPKVGPDVPDVKPPATVDPNAGLTPFEKEVKNTLCVISGADSTKAGKPDSLYYGSGLSGGNIGLKFDAEKSTDKTAVFRFVDAGPDDVPQCYGMQEISKDPSDGSLISKLYTSKNNKYNDPEQVLITTTKLRKGTAPMVVVETLEGGAQNGFTPIINASKTMVQRLDNPNVKVFNVNKFASFLKVVK